MKPVLGFILQQFIERAPEESGSRGNWGSLLVLRTTRTPFANGGSSQSCCSTDSRTSSRLTVPSSNSCHFPDGGASNQEWEKTLSQRMKDSDSVRAEAMHFPTTLGTGDDSAQGKASEDSLWCSLLCLEPKSLIHMKILGVAAEAGRTDRTTDPKARSTVDKHPAISCITSNSWGVLNRVL